MYTGSGQGFHVRLPASVVSHVPHSSSRFNFPQSLQIDLLSPGGQRCCRKAYFARDQLEGTRRAHFRNRESYDPKKNDPAVYFEWFGPLVVPGSDLEWLIGWRSGRLDECVGLAFEFLVHVVLSASLWCPRRLGMLLIVHTGAEGVFYRFFACWVSRKVYCFEVKISRRTTSLKKCLVCKIWGTSLKGETIRMSDHGCRPGSRSVVTLSEFCNRYRLSREVRASMGVWNEGVCTIDRGAFEEIQRSMRSLNQKRQRDEEWLLAQKRLCVPDEVLEGNTLDARYDYNMPHPDLLHSDLFTGYSTYHNGLTEILVSDDTMLAECTLQPSNATFQALSSAGEALRLPPKKLSPDPRPPMLSSERFCESESSPPPPRQ